MERLRGLGIARLRPRVPCWSRRVGTALGLAPMAMMLVVVLVNLQDLQAATLELRIAPMHLRFVALHDALETYRQAYGRYPSDLAVLTSRRRGRTSARP